LTECFPFFHPERRPVFPQVAQNPAQNFVGFGEQNFFAGA